MPGFCPRESAPSLRIHKGKASRGWKAWRTNATQTVHVWVCTDTMLFLRNTDKCYLLALKGKPLNHDVVVSLTSGCCSNNYAAYLHFRPPIHNLEISIPKLAAGGSPLCYWCLVTDADKALNCADEHSHHRQASCHLNCFVTSISLAVCATFDSPQPA